MNTNITEPKYGPNYEDLLNDTREGLAKTIAEGRMPNDRKEIQVKAERIYGTAVPAECRSMPPALIAAILRKMGIPPLASYHFNIRLGPEGWKIDEQPDCFQDESKDGNYLYTGCQKDWLKEGPSMGLEATTGLTTLRKLTPTAIYGNLLVFHIKKAEAQRIHTEAENEVAAQQRRN
jgi:hypothetical protein